MSSPYPLLTLIFISETIYSIQSVKLVTQLCPTFCNSMNFSPPGSSVGGILQARILKWAANPFSRGSSRPRDWTHFPALLADSLPSEPPVKPILFKVVLKPLWVFVVVYHQVNHTHQSIIVCHLFFSINFPFITHPWSYSHLKYWLKGILYPLTWWGGGQNMIV